MPNYAHMASPRPPISMLGWPHVLEVQSLAIIYVIGQGVWPGVATLKFGGAGAAGTTQTSNTNVRSHLITCDINVINGTPGELLALPL